MGNGRFRALGEQNRHAVAGFQTHFSQGVGQLSGPSSELAKGMLPLYAGSIFIIHGNLISNVGVSVADSGCYVEVVRNLPGKCTLNLFESFCTVIDQLHYRTCFVVCCGISSNCYSALTGLLCQSDIS